MKVRIVKKGSAPIAANAAMAYGIVERVPTKPSLPINLALPSPEWSNG
jgi:hypothetical protein